MALAIRAQNGTIVEQGPATLAAGTSIWTYTATTTLAQGQQVSIEVTATDRPGHTGSKNQAKT